MEIAEIQLVHFIHQVSILHQLNLMLLQLITDRLHIGFHLGIASLERFHLIGLALEEGSKSLLILRNVKVLQLVDQSRKHVSDFAHILGADVVNCLLGEVCQLLLCSDAVIQNAAGIRQINLLHKGLDLLLLRRCQNFIRIRNLLLLLSSLGLCLDLLDFLLLCLFHRSSKLQCRCLRCCCKTSEFFAHRSLLLVSIISFSSYRSCGQVQPAAASSAFLPLSCCPCSYFRICSFCIPPFAL